MIQSNIQDEHVIDIDQLVLSTARPLSYDTHKSKEIFPIIPKIDQRFKNKSEKDVYKPKSLSIGLYHYGSPGLHEMEKVKYVYLDYILKLNPEKKLADYLSALKGFEGGVKCAYYAHEIDIDRNAFLKLLLLDGCFILVALHGIEGITLSRPEHIVPDDKLNADNNRTQNNTSEQLNEHENSNRNLYYDTVVHDILLLENQIPFCVVQMIFDVLTGGDATSSLSKNIVESISDMFRSYPKQNREDFRPREFYHLLHLCHLLFKPSRLFEPGEKEMLNHQNHNGRKQATLWRPATIYHAVKIDFKKRKHSGDNPHSLLDIDFSDCTMEIPSLSIEPRTYHLLRNLVAFEQTYPQFGNYITSYVLFWSQLVRTPDDAALLIEKGIIINHLQSDKEVTNLLSVLAKDVVFDSTCDCYLKPIYLVIEAHYEHQRSKWREFLGTVSSNVHCWFSQEKRELPNAPSVDSFL